MAICLMDGNSVEIEETLIREKVYFDENIWINVSNVLSRNSDMNEIPIFADDDTILYIAEDSPKLTGLMIKLCELAKDDQIWKEVPSVHIKGMNEVLFYLEKLLERKGVPVSVEGDAWERLGIFSAGREYLNGSQIVGEDGEWIEQLYARLEAEGRKPIWNQEQWENFCKDIKKSDKSVIFCAVPGATSELIYDAFLQKEIFPEAIVCLNRFNALCGKRVKTIHELSGDVWVLAGVSDDARMSVMFEAVTREQGGCLENVYMLSGVERILPDVMLRHMIRHCGKVVLMGEKRLCGLFEKHCTELDKIEVTYVENKEQIAENADKGMEALWFYLDFLSQEAVDQFQEVSASCMQEGIYLSRYFLNRYMLYGDEYSEACFTHEEIVKMKCLKQIQIWIDECSVNHDKQNRGKRNILFTASHLSYIWDGIAPLFKYYTKRTDVECTVMFPSIWNLLQIGVRNLKETVDNITEIKKLGGGVYFYNNWDSDRKFDICYTILGFSEWYEGLIDIREVSKTVVSLQTVAYHTHYYAGNQKFEDMFRECQREESDYVVVSEFMAEWAVQIEKKWKDKLVPLGYPRMDSLYENMHNSNIPSEWKKKVEGKRVIYFTDFHPDLFMYCLEYCKKDKLVLIWRPHPYAYDVSSMRKDIEEWRNKENVIIDSNQSYSVAFNISDALVTSFCSSVQINYLFTDKPVLVLDKKCWNWGENKIDFREEAWYKAAYVANDEKVGRKFVDMIMDGKDDKREEKLPYRQVMQKGFDGMVCERIAKFADGKLGEMSS